MSLCIAHCAVLTPFERLRERLPGLYASVGCGGVTAKEAVTRRARLGLVEVTILGSSGGAPSATRETSCVLVRDCDGALLLDIGSGARRLLVDEGLLDGVRQLDVVLTHFHFDHVCGLPYLQWLDVGSAVWAPGAWLYGTTSHDILAPLLRPPIS